MRALLLVPLMLVGGINRDYTIPSTPAVTVPLPPVCGGIDGGNNALGYSGGYFCATLTGGSWAPTGAKYLVQQADGTLSAEQAMGDLGTGLVINTTTSGVQSIYTGTSCTNQFPRGLNASGAATCASVVAADISGAVSTATALASDPTDCGANTFAQSVAASGNLTCASVSLATADTTGVLTVAKGGNGAAPGASDQVLVSDSTSAATWRTVPNCTDTGGQHLNYTAGDNTFSCGTSGPGGSTDCIYIPLWSWVAQVGTVTTTTACTATINIGAVANRGHQIFVDMDRYTHAKLIYFGSMTGAQTGIVTVALRDIGAGSDAITTTFNTSTSCIDRSSATTDLTAKTGLVRWTARLGDGTAADDPGLSSVSVQFCTGTF